MQYYIHSTAEIAKSVKIGKNTKIWHLVQIRENAMIGDYCIIGKNVYIDFNVIIGNKCKIQNNCSIYYATIIEDGVFIGPHVIFTNDKYPRAITIDNKLKTAKDWTPSKILVKKGVSIGAGSIILPNIVIGKYSVIGAGSVITKSIPDFSIVYGNPGKIHGKVNKNGFLIKKYNAKE